jgi:phage baseplate assembly protein W
MDYLSIPFVLQKGYFNRVDLRESIRHSIGLIISTRIGEIPFHPEFGCDIWEKEYADIHTTSKADIRASLRNSLNKFEPRLYNISVSFKSIERSGTHPLGLAVKVSGDYRVDGEEKEFDETFTIG